MKYHYLVLVFRTGERLGKFNTEEQAQEYAKAQSKRLGGGVIVECFDNSGNSSLKNFVFSDNSCNFA